jgi:peptide chain release factor
MDEASPQEESHDRIPPDEVRFETARSSGKGGQHVNKTETAVRVVHIPTGLVAIARDERSQWHNKKLALARLGALLQSRQRQAAAASKAEIRSRHDRLERGNAVAVFIGRDFRQAAD